MIYKGKIDLQKRKENKNTITILNKSKDNVIHKKTYSV